MSGLHALESSLIPIAHMAAALAAGGAVGHQFTIGSPKQLGDILFEELRLPKGKRTKTGYSTDASVLEELAGEGKDFAERLTISDAQRERSRAILRAAGITI